MKTAATDAIELHAEAKTEVGMHTLSVIQSKSWYTQQTDMLLVYKRAPRAF